MPHTCRVSEVGSSRFGRPMQLLSVGRGERHVLVVSGAHPDEPVGGATVLRLVRWLTAEPDRLRAADVTWDFLLCLDPDGAARNGWRSGPYSIRRYLTRAFRPGPEGQPEAAAWPRPGESTVLPETRALTGVIDATEPILQCSLHGNDFGGTFLGLTRDIPGAPDALGRAAATSGLPVEARPYDSFYWDSPGRGVFVPPEPHERDAFACLPDETARTTWAYAHRYGGTTAMVESPMWAVPRVADVTEHASPATVVGALAGQLGDWGRQVDELMCATELLPQLDRADPGTAAVLRSVGFLADVCLGLAKEWSALADGRGLDGCSVGQITGLEIGGRRVPIRAAGMLHGLLARYRGRTAARLRARAARCLDAWTAPYAGELGVRWVPVTVQAGHQANVVLGLADCVLRSPALATRFREARDVHRRVAAGSHGTFRAHVAVE